VAWLPRQRILFAGDLVEAEAALYTGDAFHRDWEIVHIGRRRGDRGGRADRAAGARSARAAPP